MNDAVPVSSDGFLTTAGLAARPDFTLGLAIISPSTRTIAGPGGTADVEPRVMQVLIVLADAAGQVVTRETLFQRCWGGVFVGDDSLNRAIGAVRRIAGEVAGGSFEIETIPRTGYRLVGATPAAIAAEGEAGAADAPTFTRRKLVGASFAVAALAAVGGWSVVAPRRRFEALLLSAEESIRKGTGDEQTVAGQLTEALSIRPDSAKAWGLLAYLRSFGTQSADPAKAEPALKAAQNAAAKALGLNPREPYALLAMFELQGSTLDWAARDRRLRQIIAIDSVNLPAIGELVLLTQSAGLSSESWTWNERAISLDPFSYDYLSKRALKLWIAGRVPQADKVIDQVAALYPTNPWPKWVRFLIFAMTDRPRAARAVLAATPGLLGGPADLAVWRASLTALEERSPEAIAKAREACFEAAHKAGGFVVDTVMILAALGQVDAAFDIANGLLLSRGSVVATRTSGGSIAVKSKTDAAEDLNDATWRINTQYLFTPPCAILRADPRFLALCEGMGLTDYWHARGVRPDYQLSAR